MTQEIEEIRLPKGSYDLRSGVYLERMRSGRIWAQCFLCQHGDIFAGMEDPKLEKFLQMHTHERGENDF